MDSQTPASPTYRIFRDHHGIPQFEPKRGTQGLKDALIYAFPSLETELQLMQAALRKFFDSERGSTFVFELPERDLQTSLAKKRDIPISPAQTGKASLRSWKVSRASRTPSRPSSRASSRAPSRASSRNSRCETPTPFQEMAAPVSGGTMTTWVLQSGQELEKRKRQPYDAVKRRKVAENRGNACEKHRASKTACNASECPQNKLYSKITEQARRESEGTTYDSPAENQTMQTTNESTPASELLSTTDPSSLLDLDVFFEPTNASDLSSVMQDSFLGLDHPTTSSSATTWADNLDLGEMVWNSTRTFPPIQDSAPNEFLMDNIPLQPMETEENPLIVFSDHSFGQDAFVAPNLPAVLEENVQMEHDTSLMDSMALQQSLATFNASDDPFMGWATKRANHLFDDYGWVLSHVEAL